MISFPLKFTADPLRIITMNRTLPMPPYGAVIKYKAHLALGGSLVRNSSHCIDLGRTFSCMERTIFKMKCWGTFTLETPDITESCNKMKVSCESTSKKFKPDDGCNGSKRRVHLNKGRVPWNKGRKHSEETRQKIRQRTKEAMKDPKVRKKMSECPRALSKQTKARIRTSLTKLWGKRLQQKRLGEKFFQEWTESIAIAAKVGGSDQQELQWDSYEKIKKEIVLEQLHQVAEAKEMARIKAEKAAKLKAEKMEMVARKRREREENAKARGESERRFKRSKEEKEMLVEFQGIKLKERLTKIQKKKSRINEVSFQNERTWEKFDLEFWKLENLHKEISLADQIRLAKKKRVLV